MKHHEVIVLAQKLGWEPRGRGLMVDRFMYQRFVRGKYSLWLGRCFYVLNGDLQASVKVHRYENLDVDEVTALLKGDA